MSLINDALKQARKTPPPGTPGSLPPLAPAADDSSSVAAWLLPAVVIFLLVAAVFFIGWAVAHRSVNNLATRPIAVAAAPQAEEVASPVIAAPPPPPLNPPDAPRLQGIFYSSTAPSAIVEGKTVYPGDHFQQYFVKAITKNTITLVGSDGKSIQLGMSN
ncbi:MAG TPA: hypothetical protein VGI63_01000 [Verrucomicrobiae bacterium]|jgi:hypothetical protein